MEVQFYSSVEQLNRALRVYAKEMGRDLPELVDQAGRTLCRTMAEETQPRGSFAEGRRRGQAVARSDVHRVYITPGQMYERIKSARLAKGSRGTPEGVAKAFVKAMSAGNVDRAERIVTSSGLDGRLRLGKVKFERFDQGAEHQQRRNRGTGRVRGKVPTVVLTDAKGLQAYERKLTGKKVGRAKGAWADCSKKLGSSRGFPQWLVKAGDGQGQVERRTSFGEPYVLLTARPSYMSRVITESAADHAGRVAAGKMAKMVDIVLAKRAKQLLEG